MKICSVCNKISGTDEDHLDCLEKRRIELEDEDKKQKVPEKLDIAKNPEELSSDIKAILEHLSREKERK